MSYERKGSLPSGLLPSGVHRKETSVSGVPETKSGGPLTVENKVRVSTSNDLATAIACSPRGQRIVEAEKLLDHKVQIGLNILNDMLKAAESQKNVSMRIKRGIHDVREALDVVRHCRRVIVKALDEKAQDEMYFDVQDSQASGEDVCLQTPQAKRETSNSRNAKRDRTVVSSAETSPRDDATAKKPRKEEEWRTVTRKSARKLPENESKNQANKEKKKRKPKAKTAAIIIRPKDGKTYAEVLDSLKKNVKPEESKADIRSVRKTRAGDVLLELGVKTEDIGGFEKALQEVLGTSGDIKTRTARMSLEIRDLDELANADEIRASLTKELGEATEPRKVVVLGANSRGQKVAIVELGESEAHKLLKTARIKIGWINCRIRERTMVVRCFKCIGYGHVARDCSGPDRKNTCYKCGADNHKDKDCPAKSAAWVLCKDMDVTGAGLAHFPGTKDCVAFKKALDKAKSKTR